MIYTAFHIPNAKRIGYRRPTDAMSFYEVGQHEKSAKSRQA